MMESEVEVTEVIHLLSELVNCTGNTFGFFFLIPHYFMITMDTGYSRSSNGEIQYKRIQNLSF